MAGIIEFKKGVRVFGMKTELLVVIQVAEKIWEYLGAPLVITSVNDGKHSPASLHYMGCAVDLRIRNLQPGQAEQAANMLKRALTDEYDVILEPDHIHVEFQPKRYT